MPRSIHRIVLASRNPKKVVEINALFAPHGFELVSVADLGDIPDVIEDGDTFAANAAKKACQTATIVGEWTIGEDSGLRVDALDGQPGVYSARYSGEQATDESNNRKLMQELQDVPEDRRGAEYVCHITLSDPAGTVRLDVEATCRGRITHEPRGTNGFGYDPYFKIREYHKTFGELSPLVKRQLSHRARAFRMLIARLSGVVEEN